MDIRLKSIYPSFLEDVRSRESEVWGCELEFPTATYVNVAAPSGTGKTSFVSILYGLLKNYRGGLQFDNSDVASLSRRQWSQLRQNKLALMFQDLRLFEQLSCWDNVLLKAQQVGVADHAMIKEAFEKLGLQDRMQALAGTCSQGEKQRVAFIRALVQPFAWIFLDEPFSHLDNSCIESMRDLLLEACVRNQAGLIVTSLAPDSWLPYHRTVAL